MIEWIKKSSVGESYNHSAEVKNSNINYLGILVADHLHLESWKSWNHSMSLGSQSVFYNLTLKGV